MKKAKTIPKDVAIRVDYNYLVIDGKSLFDKLGNRATEFTYGLNLNSNDCLIYIIDMGHYQISSVYDKLVEFGLKINEDFIIDTAHSFYGVERYRHKLPKVRNIEYEVDWLEGQQNESGTYLWRKIRSTNK